MDRGTYEEELRKGFESEIVEVAECERSSFYTWLKGSPLDESTIRRILIQLNEDVEDLETLLSKGLDEMLQDRYLTKAFERVMQTSIKGVIDLLRHIISGLNLGIAEYYKDYVEICRDKRVISHEMAEKILELIPLRHSLVHRYRELNYEKLWNSANTIVEIIPRLREEIRDYLKRENVNLN
ncbi:MAG: DUF86 domain-containing protein [Candidatus Caldarchaeales archaeon]